MTVIVSMLLYIFGLDAATGSLNYKCDGKDSKTKCGDGITIDALGNIIVYDPEYNSSKNPVYYNTPNIIIPNPHNNDTKISDNKIYYNPVPNSTSSPAYQS